MGGGIAAGGSLIVALLCALPEEARSQALNLVLTPSAHNGYAITCFGAKDGTIDLTVSGGTPPYTYEWSNGATTEDVAHLGAGYYRVGVYDSNAGFAEAEITLTEPGALKGTAEAFEYPNEYNVSCNSCYNGSIDAGASGGVPPYTWTWRDGPVVEDRSGLGARDFSVMVTDVNGCVTDWITLTLREPPRNDWTMSGNAGTTPGTQYIGTSDNKDLVFKTNAVERLRVQADGDLAVPALATGGGFALMGVDSTGVLKLLDGTGTVYTEACQGGDKPFPWLLCGNTLSPGHFLGSLNYEALRFKTNNETRMFIDEDGKVGIGTTPDGPVDQYRLYVEDGIVCRDVLVKLGTWPDHVFAPEHDLMPLEELRGYLARNRHLPGIPSAAELETRGGVELGDIQRRLLQVVEEQALYILQLEHKQRELEQRLEVLETSER